MKYNYYGTIMRRKLLTEAAEAIQPSVTQDISARAKKMIAEGIDVIDFGVGEPDFDTPKEAKEAAIEAITNNHTHYTPAQGYPNLKRAIVDKWVKRGLVYQPNQVVVAAGGKAALTALANATLGPGDDVIIPTPYWVSYPEIVRSRGATPIHESQNSGGRNGPNVHCRGSNGFQLDVSAIEKLITDRTKYVIYSSPSNPTGTLLTRGTLEDLGELAMSTGVSVISDEMYADILYDGHKHVSIASLAHNTGRYGTKFQELEDLVFVLDGASKSYAMTGWRVGWIAGPQDVMSKVAAIKSHTEGNVNNIAQEATIAALTRSQSATNYMVRQFAKRKERVWYSLNEIPGVSCNNLQGAFYAFPKVNTFYGMVRPDTRKPINGSVDLANYLLDHGHVALTPGAAFGRDHYVRISYATSMPTIKKGLERIKNALLNLRPGR